MKTIYVNKGTGKCLATFHWKYYVGHVNPNINGNQSEIELDPEYLVLQ